MITLYTQPFCTHCKAVKRYLHENNIEFTEIPEDHPDSPRFLLAYRKKYPNGRLEMPILVDNDGESCAGLDIIVALDNEELAL